MNQNVLNIVNHGICDFDSHSIYIIPCSSLFLDPSNKARFRGPLKQAAMDHFPFYTGFQSETR